MRTPAIAITSILYSLIALNAAVKVKVVFQNGDQLTGELQHVDATGVDLHPSVSSLGNSVRFNWATDGIAAINLGKSANDQPACVYLSGTPASRFVGALPGGKLCFQSAVLVKQRGTTDAIHLSAEPLIPANPSASRQVPNSATNYRWIKTVDVEAPAVAPATPSAPPPVATTTNAAPAQTNQFPSIWALNINAPESIVQGTQSQQQFGGLFRTDLYAGDQNHFAFVASGSHQHNLSLHKPGTRTDIYDSVAQMSHVNTHQFGIYGVGEWFLNTSLGMAAERSVGGGLLFPSFSSKSGNLYANTWLDFRYFNERLYSGKKLNLAGAVVHGEVDYTPSNASWFITFGTAAKPMFNDFGASQVSGSFTFTLPISTHVCATLTPADDTYIGNSPTGFRRNYLKSSVGLQILAGSNSSQKCK